MDDFTAPLIPLQQDDDPLLCPYEPAPTIHPYLNHTIPHQDLVNPGASSFASHLENNEVTITSNNIDTKKMQKKPASAILADNDTGKNSDEKKQKRAFHREIERHRRQEMTNLYASLRDLLPLEYIKGKRSVSDHVHEAVNYIKHLENNIKEFELKRDKLRNSMATSSHLGVNNAEETNSTSITFTVRPCSSGGIEILMKNNSDSWFPLSRVLNLLLDEGLTAVSCVCTKINEKFLYTIQTEASYKTDIDLLFLQEKLTEKFGNWNNFGS